MKQTAVILFLALFVPGCLNYIQDVQLYPDGSGTMRINYWMSMPDSIDSGVIEKIGIFNKDSINNEFSSPYSSIESVEVYTDSVDSTTHAIIDLNFQHIDSLNYTKAFQEADFQLRDGAAGQKIFTQFIPPIATGFGVDGSRYNVMYKYTFYGEIITHNAHDVDDKTLTWNYTLSEIGSGKTISVTFRPYKIKETPYWIYILSGSVLLLVIFFLFRKKKD